MLDKLSRFVYTANKKQTETAAFINIGKHVVHNDMHDYLQNVTKFKCIAKISTSLFPLLYITFK